MAINVSFNGATIYRPGAYSKTNIDLGGNLPLGPAGLVAIFGEADAGMPGANEVDISRNFYTADRFAEARAKYRSGPILDALNFLFSPAADGSIANGAQTVWVYKTNASVRAEKALTWGAFTTSARAMEWGTGGNRITIKIEGAGSTRTITLAQKRDLITETAIVGGNVVLSFTDKTPITGVAASFTGVFAGGTTPVTITAVNVGIAGNIALVGDGVKTIQTLVTDWNTAHPTNLLVTPITGIGTQVPDLDENIQLAGGIDAVSTALNLTINASTIVVKRVTTTNAIPGSPVIVGTFVKSAFKTIKDIVEAIQLTLDVGESLDVENTVYNQKSLEILDYVVAAASVKMDAFEVRQFFAESQIAELVGTATLGLPTAMTEVAFTGGEKGATAGTEIINALAKFTKFHMNFIVPLFSRDATEDIADELTDSDSDYEIAAIHQAVRNHVSAMKSTKKRSERQGYLSIKDTYENCRTQAGLLADARMQLVIQDVRQADSNGSIKWFQPWAFACMLAGARGGASIGLPMTFKFINCAGIRQTAQGMNTPEADIVLDFDPDTMYDDAIQGGITFLEAPTTGGFRVVVDNTTYGIDDNWVWNRGNVIYAADIVAYNFRNTMERRYVGVKNTVRASEVKATAESVLVTFLSQGITVSTADAPNGFKDLSVRMEGNTIYITVTIKLVEGIDFILNEITVQRATQSA